MGHLSGRTALVTGSVQGIGLAIAKALAGEGVRIALHGLASPEEAAAAEQACRGAGAPETRFFDADMRDVAAIDAMMEAAAAWGPIDILVNNAGIQKTVPIGEATAEIWDAIIAVNLSGAFHTMRHALPGMGERGFGRVVNIASVHGLVASKDKAPYVAENHPTDEHLMPLFFAYGAAGENPVAERACNYMQYGMFAWDSWIFH